MKKLNLGSGKDYKNEWVNLDYNSDYRVDVNQDLNQFPYPFENEEFDLIYCSHILEHVDDVFECLEEIQRILKVEGILHVRVPHFSNGNGYCDLTHKRFFGWQTFDQLMSGYYNKNYDFKIIERRLNFLAEGHAAVNKLFGWFLNMLPKQFYERFLCWVFPVGEVEVKFRKTAGIP